LTKMSDVVIAFLCGYYFNYLLSFVRGYLNYKKEWGKSEKRVCF